MYKHRARCLREVSCSSEFFRIEGQEQKFLVDLDHSRLLVLEILDQLAVVPSLLSAQQIHY